jgi:hypothetical protein
MARAEMHINLEPRVPDDPPAGVVAHASRPLTDVDVAAQLACRASRFGPSLA